MLKKYIRRSFWLAVVLFVIIGLLCLLFVFSNKSSSSVANIYRSTIFIDPGHGGKDNGTSYENVFEDEINLKFSTILYEQLLDNGCNSYISRIGDYDLSSMYAKNHKLEDLKKRISYIENSNADLFISLHLNYYPSGNVNGLQVFYQKGMEKSKLLATIMQEKVNRYNKKDKKIKVGDFYILNHCKIPGILLEFGFLSSEYDRNKLMDDAYLKQLSQTLILGMDEYLAKISEN